ncbi:hypothetical protein PGB90_007207 [Kerria lacca]
MNPNQPPRGRARGRSRPAAERVDPGPIAGSSIASNVSTSSSGDGASLQPIGRALARKRQSDVGDLTQQTSQMDVAGSDNGSDNGNGNGDGNGAMPIGRGTIRSGVSLEITPLTTRPEHVRSAKTGASGQTVQFSSNHFLLKTAQNWILCKHHVDFNPPEDRTHVRKLLLRIHRDKFAGYLFDGSTLFTTQNACPQGKLLELISERNDGQKVNITVKFVGTCEPGDYQYLQVFNIIIRECLSHLKLQLIRRNYFDPGAKIQIPEHHLELWPGYVTAVGQYEREILLNCEISYKVLRMDTAYHIFKEFCERGGDIRKGYDSAMVGAIVLTNYNNKTYRVDEVDYTASPKSTFAVKKKGEVNNVSYLSYYENRYSITIKDLKQPMLISRSNARDKRAGLPDLVYLVPELCLMTGITDDMRTNHQLMRAVATHTSVGPSNRVERLLEFNRRLNGIPQVKEKLNSWGMKLAPEPVKIAGRILPPETIYVSNNNQFNGGQEADWTKNLRSNRMLLNVDLNNWVIIYPGRCERDARNFCDVLNKVGRGMHFNIARPTAYSISDDRPTSYIQMIDRAVNERNPQLVLFVATNNRSDRYNMIKKKCIVDKSVPSQVVLNKTLQNRGIMSITTKIAVQINCKIGGAPWSVAIPVNGLMAVGFDVCHDPTDKRKSYSGIVATLDKSCSRYFSAVTHHNAGEELSINFSENIKIALERFQMRNEGNLPKVIVIYRDGVGDGNLKYVYEQEVQEIKKKLNEIYQKKNVPLKLAFIIVTKRINTRIFYGNRNPPPGSIVDDVITNPLRYDFFLVSQSVRQGTVSPTHYNVLEDTTNFKPDQMQRLTYKFTHLYYNWSGTVRVPAPCQYAHKLAFLTAQSVCRPHSNMDQLLYYL